VDHALWSHRSTAALPWGDLQQRNQGGNVDSQENTHPSLMNRLIVLLVVNLYFTPLIEFYL
jgi:hypothetical protein